MAPISSEHGTAPTVIGMSRVAIATAEHLPDLDADSRLLLPHLAAEGVDAQPAIWSDDTVDWSAFDAVLIRSTWDYFHHEDAFDAWIDRVARTTALVNPAHVLKWNAHKTYLRDLGERGVPVVDTLWVHSGERAEVPWAEGIVKPAVAGNALGLERVRRGDEVAANGKDLMVQPFLESITSEGELSLLYAAGELSHVVRKVPRPGDIRVQPEYGSDIRPEEPSGEALEAAGRVLAEIDDELAYARVDLVRAADGTLRLIELEVIEPSLYLAWDGEAPARFASAVARAVAALPA
jgi:glutathione synthase/RimK-type ligase-like ATP-grasp enzyme